MFGELLAVLTDDHSRCAIAESRSDLEKLLGISLKIYVTQRFEPSEDIAIDLGGCRRPQEKRIGDDSRCHAKGDSSRGI